MIDTHCHIDLFSNPINIIEECECLGITTIGVTNLPSHFEMGYPHVLRYKKVRLALGLHPLYAEQHKVELEIFLKNIHRTSYIGEIGLDFSREGISTKEIQLDTFKKILSQLKGQKKILSIHSRKAEKVILQLLLENKIENVIFHWYSGPPSLIDEISNAGYYFSINPAMILSKSGQEIIRKMPVNRILTESDAPFIEIEKRPSKPSDVRLVYEYLSKSWQIHLVETEKIIADNFSMLIAAIK